MTDNTADVIVIGLGAVGSAITHHMARGGARVIGIDRHHPPHIHGSSHGHSRITRLAIGEGLQFVPLVQRSHALWRELEAETGEELYRRTGGLMVASEAADAGLVHGRPGFFATTTSAARRFGIEHEMLDADEVRRRFPQFLLADHESAYYEADAGMLFPERCVSAQLSAARRHGAVLQLGERVLDVTRQGAALNVRTEDRLLSAARVVLCAGAWTPGLGGPAVARHLAVRRQVLYWLRTTAPALYSVPDAPIFIWQHGSGPSDSMYGFPMGDGIDGVKVATEFYGAASDPDAVDRTVGAAEVRAMYEDHVRGRLAHLLPEAVATATCLYTSTEQGDFIVDGHPAIDGLTVVSACSGHGFKHSAGLGLAVAEKLLGQQPYADLGAFSWPRGARAAAA